MKEQKINLKLELTEGYQKRFTESYCRRVLAKKNQRFIPPKVTTEKGGETVEVTKRKNDKQAAEYIRRLVNGEIPEMKVEVNYSESQIAESDG